MEVALALVLVGLLLFRFGPELRARAGLPMMAPDLELVTLAGDTVRLAELRGSVVLVNFWATWCAPCLTEMPLLQQVWDDYAEEGFLVVGLSVDEGPVVDFVARLRDRGVAFPLAMSSPRAERGLGFGGTLPTTILVDRDGRVAGYTVGAVREAELRDRLERLLR